MTIEVIMFGVAQDIFGGSTAKVESNPANNFKVSDLKSALEKQKPALKDLGSYLIAVNNEYADDELIIQDKDEVAVIPPVSGG